MDAGDALFSRHVVPRIHLLSLAIFASWTGQSSESSYWAADVGVHHGDLCNSDGFLKATRNGRSNTANIVAVGLECRPFLRSSVHDGTADPSVVHARLPRTISLSIVLAFEHRVADCVGIISICFRTVHGTENDGLLLDNWVLDICWIVRDVRFEHAENYAGSCHCQRGGGRF